MFEYRGPISDSPKRTGTEAAWLMDWGLLIVFGCDAIFGIQFSICAIHACHSPLFPSIQTTSRTLRPLAQFPMGTSRQLTGFPENLLLFHALIVGQHVPSAIETTSISMRNGLAAGLGAFGPRTELPSRARTLVATTTIVSLPSTAKTGIQISSCHILTHGVSMLDAAITRLRTLKKNPSFPSFPFFLYS